MAKQKRIETENRDGYYIYDEETKTLKEKRYGFFSDPTVEEVKTDSLEDALAYIKAKGEKIKAIKENK